MSESAQKIIKYFCDRFLELDYYPPSISAIFDLKISVLKNLKQENVKKLNGLGVDQIKDFSNLEVRDIKKIVKNKVIDPSILQSALVATSLISNAWKKRVNYLRKAQMKVVIAGLDFAGKTSLINRLMNINYTDTINIEPTIGANVEEFQSERLNLVVWDLGGQKNHIDEYLTEPEKFFVQVDVLIFVVDSQDDKRYTQAVKYLSDIINILDFLNEMPFLMILLNKADSDIIEDPDYLIKLEYLTEQVTNIFVENEKNWQFEITPTSIYNFYSNQPEIVRSIKDIFTPNKDKGQKEPQKVPETENKQILERALEKNIEIEEKLQKILDINLKLMEKVATELSDIKRVLYRITPSEISKTLLSIPFEKVPQEYIALQDKKLSTQKKKKKTKEKPKKDSKTPMVGPPKRLDTLPTPEGLEKGHEQDSKVNDDKIQQAKQKLTPKLLGTLANPKRNIIDGVDINALLPPPPPPKPIKIERNPGQFRSQVISELKEMFVKRGLVNR